MIDRFIAKVRQYGLSYAVLKAACKVFFYAKKVTYYYLENLIFRKIYKSKMIEILNTCNYKSIIVLYPGSQWNMILKQRPHHIADYLSREGYLYFYCTDNYNENIKGFKNIQKNLYVTNQYSMLIKELKNYYLHLYANWDFHIEDIDYLKGKGVRIIYEYADEFSEKLFNITEDMYIRHQKFLENDEIIFVTTATKLYKDVVEKRGSDKNVCLSTNGVKIDDFTSIKESIVPKDMQKIIEMKRPIIGYYGALGSWFDTELIKKIAATNTFSIVIIGLPYLQSYDSFGFDKYDSIFYLGPKQYFDLISYATHFDISIIPFLVNDITLSVSPVKLFEYMALGHPIVTTNMPECAKYKSVLLSDSHEQFIYNLQIALNLRNDENYKKVIQADAYLNSWSEKVKPMISLIENNK